MKTVKLAVLVIFFSSGLFGQSDPHSSYTGKGNAASDATEGFTSLTIYLIPSRVKYDWSSPHSLYCSLIRNYIRNIFKKECYLLGHAFLELELPGDSAGVISGMRSTNREQQKELLFEEHYGLAILGTGLEGRLQTREELECQIDRYSRKGKMAFIRFLVNDEAAERMLQFYESYKLRLDSIGLAYCYGGVYWPRFYGEGSGCSAYVMSFADVAGLLRDEYRHWRVDINIPMELIGGPYSPGNQVELKEIKKCRSRMDCNGQNLSDHEPFWIYDPTMMYDWVMNAYKSQEDIQGMKTEYVRINKAKGIEIDTRRLPVPDEPIFMQRNEPSLFINSGHSEVNRQY